MYRNSPWSAAPPAAPMPTESHRAKAVAFLQMLQFWLQSIFTITVLILDLPFPGVPFMQKCHVVTHMLFIFITHVLFLTHIQIFMTGQYMKNISGKQKSLVFFFNLSVVSSFTHQALFSADLCIKLS